MNDNWRTKNSNFLFQAFLTLRSEDEMAAFCRDIMTEPEIEALSGRLAAAAQLYAGISQREVSSDTGVSIATVTRVNQWLSRGLGGYKTVLDRLSQHHPR